MSDLYQDDGEDIFWPSDASCAAQEQDGLWSRFADRSNRDVVDSGEGLARTWETVRSYAERAGVDIDGVNVEVVDDPEVIRYLDLVEAMARTDAVGIQLGPAAFVDEETLVRTLAHERVHVTQYQQGRVDSDTERLEAEAYAAEDAYVRSWRGADQ